MIVAIDVGNTRLKWGVFNGTSCVSQGALQTAEAPRLSEIAAEWPRHATIAACNVAGASLVETINTALSPRFQPVRWLRSSIHACGVRNHYDQPQRLGADRWAALIGAHHRASGDCLVVCAGTATTVDWLDAEGNFRGGAILPGFDLMRSALAQNTALLPLAEGSMQREPRNTMDAIVSGCLNAQLGAIERMFAPLADKPGAVCLITGGAAPLITPHLNIHYELAENLILDGLVRFCTSL